MHFGFLVIYSFLLFNWVLALKSDSYSFFKALQYCESKKQHLVTIEDHKKFREIVSQLENQKIPEAWIGLTTFANRLKPYWISEYSAELLLVDWQRPHVETCVSIQRKSDDFSKASRYILESRDCRDKLPYFCSNLTEITNHNKNSADMFLACPNKFVEIDGDCFAIVPEKQNWLQSKNTCESMDTRASLAVIKNAKQLYAIEAMLNRDRENTTKQVWMGLQYDGRVLITPERHKQKIQFTNWGPIQPRKINDNDNCVHICLKNNALTGEYRGNWFLKNCSNQYSSICSISGNSNYSFSTNDKNGLFNSKLGFCSVGFSLNENMCYESQSNKLVNITEAQKTCEYKHTNLIKPLSNIDLQVPLYLVMAKYAGDKPNYLWIDWQLSIKAFAPTLHIDMPVNLNLKILRMPIDEMHFIQNGGAKSLCLRVHSDNRMIEAVRCDNESAVTVCQKNAVQNSSQPAINKYNYNKPSSIQYSCPPDWILLNDRCYYIHHKELYQRNDSLYACKLKNKELDEQYGTNNDSNNMFELVNLDEKLNRYLDNLKGIDYEIWIGLEIWIQNNMITFNWYNGEPISHLNIDLSSFDTVNQSLANNTWTKLCATKTRGKGWKFVHCDAQKAMMFCSRKPNLIVSTSTSTSTSTNRPTTTSTITTTTTEKPTTPAPPPKFEILSTPVKWEQARSACESVTKYQGYVGSLAYFNNYHDMFEMIRSYEGDSLQIKVWIGLKGLYSRFDNSFLSWTLNKKIFKLMRSEYFEIAFQNFKKSNLYHQHFDNNELANCVTLNLADLKWIMHSCQNLYKPVCRYTRVNTGVNLVHQNRLYRKRAHYIVNKCPNGYIQHKFKCYHVVDDTKLDWYGAESVCRQKESTLAIIESKYENSFVYSLLSENYRNTLENSSYWIYGKPTSNNDTNYKSNTEPCPAISGYPDPYIGARWFRDNCLHKKKFICFVTLNQRQYNMSITQRPMNPICDPHFKQYDNILGHSCYKVMINPGNSYQNSLSLIHHLKNAVHLTSLLSHYHTHFLLSELEMKGIGRDLPVLLGLRVPKKQHSWVWDHGMTVRYTMWNKIPKWTQIRDAGCFLFYQEMNKDGEIGMILKECSEIEPEYSIRFALVLETIYPKQNNLLKYSKRGKQCVSTKLLTVKEMKQYTGSISQTADGRQCVRWDLTKYRRKLLETEWRKFPMTNNVDTNQSQQINAKVPGFVEYHSNECRYLPSMFFQYHHNKMVKLWCMVLQNKDMLNPIFDYKECTMELCKEKNLASHKIYHSHHHKITGILVCLFFILLIMCVLFGIMACRRYQQSFPSNSRRNPLLRMTTAGSLDNSGSTAVIYARGTSFNNPVYKAVSSVSA